MRKILGIPLTFFVIGLVIIGGATAALLTYYGTITTTANVWQSILLDGKDVNTGSLGITDTIAHPAPGGEEFCFTHNLLNQMSEPGQVDLVTTVPNGEGITTTYWVVVGGDPVPGDVDAVTPSTNDINKVNSWAYVDATGGAGEVTLKLVSTRTFASCFEYRTDGDTSQVLTTNGGVNYNTNVLDGLYPFYCQNNNNRQVAIPANEYIEVRMVFGAETDERFDWTKFYVASAPLTPPVTLASGESLDFSLCHSFVQNIWPGTYTITTNAVPVV